MLYLLLLTSNCELESLLRRRMDAIFFKEVKWHRVPVVAVTLNEVKGPYAT